MIPTDSDANALKMMSNWKLVYDAAMELAEAWDRATAINETIAYNLTGDNPENDGADLACHQAAERLLLACRRAKEGG